MIDAVEGGKQIEQRQQREVAGIECHEYVCEHLEDRSFGRVVSCCIGGFKVREQITRAVVLDELSCNNALK